MFLRQGQAFGPIVATTDTHVTIELLTPYNRDGEHLQIERKSLLDFARQEVEIWEEMNTAG